MKDNSLFARPPHQPTRRSNAEPSRRVAARAALGIAVLAIVAACGGSGDASSEDGTQITIGTTSDVLSLDPTQDISALGRNVLGHIYSALTRIDDKGEPIADLATEWSTTDAVTWDFTIRDDFIFHDGSPVTIDDVLWSYQMIIDDEASPAHPYTSQIKSVKAVDETHLRFVMNGPYAAFARQVSLIKILPQAAYERLGSRFAEEPVGSGPYRISEWVKDDRVVLKAFSDYPLGEPEIKTVTFRPVPSDSARVSALIAGDVDIITLLPAPLVSQLEGESDIRLAEVQSNKNLYLGFEVRSAPMNDPLLRQAVNIGIDRSAITDGLLSGLGVPAGQPMAPTVYGFNPDLEVPQFDPEAAKDLVEQSGYDGEPIVFQYPTDRYVSGVEVAEAVAANLEDIGINVKLEGMPYTTYLPLWSERKLSPIHLFAVGPSLMDPEIVLTNVYGAGSRGTWEDPELDALIAEQRALADPAERQEKLNEIWDLSDEFVPYVWLYTEVQVYGIRKGIDWEPRSDEILLFDQATVS